MIKTFKKLEGIYTHRQGRKVTVIKPDDIITISEAELRKHDPELKTWEEVTDGAAVSSTEDSPKPDAPQVETAPVLTRTKKGNATEITKRELFLKPVKGKKGFVNIVDKATNEAINKEPLKQADAQAILDEIEKEQ